MIRTLQKIVDVRQQQYALASSAFKGLFIAISILLGSQAYAGFYITTVPSAYPPAKTNYSIPTKPINSDRSAISSTSTTTSYHAQLQAGSLRENIKRAGEEGHWGQVVWSLAYDYYWPSDITLSSHSLQELLNKILEDYPLKAEVYPKNHVVVITHR